MPNSTVLVQKIRTETPDSGLFKRHTHDKYELFCFLEGHARYLVEDAVYQLHPGDIILIKKSQVHSLLLDSQSPYERLVVHFDAEVLSPEGRALLVDFWEFGGSGEYSYFPAQAFPDRNWLYYLRQMYQMQDNWGIACGYLTVLLQELHDALSEIRKPGNDSRNVIPEVIRYINTHLTESLNVDLLCREFYISRAQLNRNFRKITGSSVWGYVITKRLLLARELLKMGESPTVVCNKVGFRDYSPFYRAYKAQFGISPKQEYIR